MPKLLKAAQGQECTMQTPWCNNNPQTVVACHSNDGEDGKGMGQKADDIFIAFGCSGCHKWYDEGPVSKEEKRDVFIRAMKRTWRILIKNEILK